MKRVLIIHYHFPPVMGDSGRMRGFVRLLPAFDWQPIVLSAAESVSYEKDYSLLREVPDDIGVHRVGHREPSTEWQYARSKFRINYVFPDYYKSWYSPALREARKILQREKVDLLFSSYPYTAHFVAMKLKKEFNIPWVAEWRDLWSGNEFLNLDYDKTLIRPLRGLQRFQIRRGERDILRVADKTVVVHWHHKQQLCELHKVEEKTIELVTHGYDESDFKELKPRALYPNRLTIIFLGNFYRQFLEPLLNFLKAVNEVDKDAEVVFIGQGAAALQGINMPNLTRILHLPKEKALAFASGSDFLFIVMPPYAKWMPSKIFEYLRLGKPILALAPKDGDTAKIVEEAKAGFVLSHDQGEMKKQLKGIFNQWRQGEFKDFEPDWKYIVQFERRNLTKRLVAVFDEVTTRGNNT